MIILFSTFSSVIIIVSLKRFLYESSHKIVRDKIPAIIIAGGNTPKTRILSDEEYKKELDKKLLEEVNEYLESGDIEEIADIQEVIKAIIKAKSFSKEEVKRIRKEKADKRGGFDDKILLESVMS